MMDSVLQDYREDLSLEQQLEWLHAIIASIHDGVLVIDDKAIVRLINPEYTRITGVKAEHIIGKPLREVRPGSVLVETLEDGKPRAGIYRKEGNYEYVVDMAPIKVGQQVVGAVSICKGLTEVHTLSQELNRHKEKLKQWERKVGSLYQANYSFDQIIGASGGLREVIQMAKKASDSHLPILIMGESGTGKELFAQATHNASPRAERPFIPVNCAAIPSALIESELFGYDEGSFTNAKKGGKVGLFEIADTGTIFLDEIGELSYDLQAKLLRVLQEGTIRKVGETKEKRIDVRVVAATNKDLSQLVEKNLFREDLYYRLNVLTLQLPPLRERKQDIAALVESMLQGHPTFSVTDQTHSLLQRYDWPGNVRELKNAVDHAICMAEGTEVLPHHLPKTMLKSTGLPDPLQKQTRTLKNVVEETERQWIIETLQRYGDDVEEKRLAAEELGVSLATLYNKMKKYDLT
ncbi:sigma-54-dependent Fis family transcriptional regulator [Ammoniphilus sp. YIM 78166]|uniref:sigma-54 interaction domain-containing protein n=1 Tax=Ammoniphilus sp. YIM 78166 TaxID=1644106 RepID=UPI001F10B1A9|nr:sigma 54-interacting transcriptional regulator [Ammoniphilus sp. YIM 78166]